MWIIYLLMLCLKVVVNKVASYNYKLQVIITFYHLIGLLINVILLML